MADLLKFITCGSVDDGKSTLIGHILYDSKLLYADQEKALKLESKVGSRGGDIDYSLLLDGLTEEREQGITIDVAYRYFTTDIRSFIVADTPGHEEYTRNMAVGASVADLAIILTDAEKGVLAQTKRHARICSIMGIRYFVFAVNKMDLVSYDEARFRQIEKDIDEFSKELGLENIKVIPVSATEGDNVTRNSPRMPWYTEENLLAYLEKVDVRERESEQGFCLPIQRVCRPDHLFRGFQGQIESGEVEIGDEITVLPRGEKAHVKQIYVGDRKEEKAVKGQPVTVQLDREVDVSRGSVIEKDSGINTADSVTAALIWMDDQPLTNGGNYFIKLGTGLIPGVVTKILYSIDVNTGKHCETETLEKNGIGVCNISFTDRIATDRFVDHKTLGELILIDRVSFMTSACGVVEKYESDQTYEEGRISRKARSIAMGQKAVTIVIPQNDKSELYAAEKELILEGKYVYVLDGEKERDKDEILHIAEHLNNAGIVVLLPVEKEDTYGFDKNTDLVFFKGEQTRERIVSFVKEESRFDQE